MNDIKILRAKTGAGIVECKKALEESGGNIEKAVELLRKKGIAKASKRADRDTSEGLIRLAINDEQNEAYMFKLCAETDFVVKNEKFQKYADDLLILIKKHKPETIEELMDLAMEKGSAGETLANLSGTIGEKMSVSDFSILNQAGGQVSAYSHLGGKIGVLVAFSKEIDNNLARDIAMQIAAANPQYISPDEVPAELIAKEKEVYRAQSEKEEKPTEIIEKIIDGRINKFFSEICLLEQEFIKDDKKRVKEILGDTEIKKFIRYNL